MRTLEREVLESSYQNYDEWKRDINRLDKQKEGLVQDISFLKQEKKLLETKIEELKREEKEAAR